MQWKPLALGVLAFLGLQLEHGDAAGRIALVIGNSAYEHAAPLRNGRGDAEAMAGKLQELGYEVVTGYDQDASAMRRTIRSFTAKLPGSDAALFFYAGHGLQVDGTNYLAPIDAVLKSQDDLEYETFKLDLVLGPMQREANASIVFLDACRDNPLIDNLARSMGTRSSSMSRGLARVETGVGTFVGFATQPGNVALDGRGEHSPFAAALLQHIDTPNLDIEAMMRRVREEVVTATAGRQVPWTTSSLLGTGFKFKETAPEPMPVAKDTTVEVAFWDTVKDSDNPAQIRVYLNKYPTGEFATLAKVMLEEMAAGQKAQEQAQRLAEKLKADQAAEEEAQRKKEALAMAEAVAAGEKEKSEAEEAQKLAAHQPAAVVNESAEELEYWKSIRNSKNLKRFQAYLKRYPKGSFVDIAKARIIELEKPKQAEPIEKKPGKPAKAKKPVAKKAITPTQKAQPTANASKQSPKLRDDECGVCSPSSVSVAVAVFCGAKYRRYKAWGRCK